MSECVIKVENVWKEYRLGVISHHTLTRDLQSWWARVRRKEDPNAPILAASSATSSLSGDQTHFWALRDVSFEVKQGDVFGIIGRNGAGKSTLLKILSQVTAPSKGEICYNGRIASLLEVGTGFHPELTGRENIFLNGAILGMSKVDICRRLDEIVEFAEIGKFLDTPVKRYSSGMYVRLAFAVAAHLEPEILVVDEVLAVGDVQFQKKCLGKMEDVGKQGRTILFVSHNMVAMRHLCNAGMMLISGEIVRQGNIDNVVDDYLQLKSVAEPDGRIVAANNTLGVSLIKIDFIDDKGAESEALRVGAKGSIRLLFETVSLLKDIIASISVNTLDGVRVCVLHTGISSNRSIHLHPPMNYLLCELAKVPFLPGVYRLHIKVAHGNGDVIFHIPYARDLMVDGGDFFGTGRLPESNWGGINLLEHSWHVEARSEVGGEECP